MKHRDKKYTEEDLKRAFNAGQDLDAEFSLPARWKFRDYNHYKRFLRLGKKVGGLYETNA